MSFLMKDPGASLDYAVDWGLDYLDDDRLVQSQWSITPAQSGGATIVADRFDDTIASVTVGGGVAGTIYRLANEVVTAAGRRDRRSIMLRVEKR